LFLAVSRLTPMLNVDLLISDEHNHQLMTWRADQFYGPGWHIPGGVVRFKETMHQRIAAVAKSELSTSVTAAPAPVRVFEMFNSQRDTRGHFISMVFRCKLTSPLSDTMAWNPKNAPQPGQWAWFKALPPNTISQHRVYKDLFNQLPSSNE
jgi:colanic acid biosynthesis protein WcaH